MKSLELVRIRVLVLGSGPIAATRRFECAHGSIETVSCDAFSRLYRQIALETDFHPPEGFPESLASSWSLCCYLLLSSHV